RKIDGLKKYMENIQSVIDRFLEFRKTVKNHRYESWEHCYSQFQSHIRKENLSDQKEDNLALHLAFYLASWGMYRGSSFLLQRDYKVLIPIVRILFKSGKHFNDKRLTIILNSEAQIGFKEYVDDYFDLDTLLLNELETIRFGVKGKIDNEVSYTLRTKILLGTLGCIPAYDRFFKDGIKLNGDIALIQSYSENGLKKLMEFSRSNITSIKEAQETINKLGFEEGYPMMKIIDMYFFQLGLEKDKKEKEEEKAEKTRLNKKQ
ncbi:MAG: hypothetical protein ACPGD5_05320, partial [Salibacteraceae bacterium]